MRIGIAFVDADAHNVARHLRTHFHNLPAGQTSAVLLVQRHIADAYYHRLVVHLLAGFFLLLATRCHEKTRHEEQT